MIYLHDRTNRSFQNDVVENILRNITIRRLRILGLSTALKLMTQSNLIITFHPQKIDASLSLGLICQFHFLRQRVFIYAHTFSAKLSLGYLVRNCTRLNTALKH